jgi:hypothetical protein
MCSTVYDTVNGVFKFVAWLEKDGQIIDDPLPLSVVVLVTDAQGTTITELANDNPEAETGAFKLTSAGITITADNAYFQRCVITDADNVEYKSGSSPVTWD